MQTRVEIDFSSPGILSALETGSFPQEANVSNNERVLQRQVSQGFKGFHFSNDAGNWITRSDGSAEYYPDGGYPGFISRQISQSDGSCSIAFTFLCTGVIPEELYITFDRVCNEWASQLKVTNNKNSNSMTVNNNKPVVRIRLTNLYITDLNNLQLTIQILKWNQPFKNLKILSFSFAYQGVFNENMLIRYECSESMLDTRLNVNTDEIVNYADVELYDRDGMIREFAQEERLMDGQKLTVWATDENEIEYFLGDYFVDQWDVRGTSDHIRIKAADAQMLLGDLYAEAEELADRNVDTFLNIVFRQAKFPYTYLTEADLTHCQKIITPNSWWYSKTVKELFTMIRALGQIKIYWYKGQFVVARLFK